jgi:hypothetical protein
VSIPDSARPKRALGTRVRSIRGNQYVARGDEIYHLSDVAGDIWRLSDGTRTLAEVASAIAEEYDVALDVLRADVGEFVETFAAAGFLEVVRS